MKTHRTLVCGLIFVVVITLLAIATHTPSTTHIVSPTPTLNRWHQFEQDWRNYEGNDVYSKHPNCADIYKKDNLPEATLYLEKCPNNYYLWKQILFDNTRSNWVADVGQLQGDLVNNDGKTLIRVATFAFSKPQINKLQNAVWLKECDRTTPNSMPPYWGCNIFMVSWGNVSIPYTNYSYKIENIDININVKRLESPH